MKILFVAEFFPSNNELKFTGGVEAYNYFLVKELAKNNRVVVICRNIAGETTSNFLGKAKIIRIGNFTKKIDTSFSTIPERILFNFKGLWYGLKEDFDLVQGNNFVTYPLAFMLGLLKGKPKVAWYADVFLGKWTKIAGLLSGTFGEMVERATLHLPWNFYIALSVSTKEKLLAQNIDPKKIDVIYGGVDQNLFNIKKIRKAKIFTVCVISRLMTYKRIDLLIKAAEILMKKKLKFQIKIIGKGPEKEKLAKMATGLGVDKRIKWMSDLTIDQLIKQLKSSHILCHPSEEEGFGLVVIEAASCGLPYVISDIPVLKEISKNGLGGKLFKHSDQTDLASKLEEMILKRSEYNQLKKDTLKLASLYNWPIIAQQFEKVYAKILK